VDRPVPDRAGHAAPAREKSSSARGSAPRRARRCAPDVSPVLGMALRLESMRCSERLFAGRGWTALFLPSPVGEGGCRPDEGYDFPAKEGLDKSICGLASPRRVRRVSGLKLREINRLRDCFAGRPSMARGSSDLIRASLTLPLPQQLSHKGRGALFAAFPEVCGSPEAARRAANGRREKQGKRQDAPGSRRATYSARAGSSSPRINASCRARISR
jgi:hypothetical protein